MKKLLMAALCLLLAGLCACGQASLEPEPVTTTAPPTTTEQPAMKPIECPASYKGAPKAYKPVLDNLYTFVCLARQGDPELTRAAFDNTGIINPSVQFAAEDLGYAIEDINNDSISELLILRKDSSVLSLYTLKNEKPVDLLIPDWGSRTAGQFAADGTLYTQ